MFNQSHNDQLIRGPWSQKCSNCQYWEEGRCTLIDQPTGREDWCKDYKRQRQVDKSQ